MTVFLLKLGEMLAVSVTWTVSKRRHNWMWAMCCLPLTCSIMTVHVYPNHPAAFP